MGMNGIQDFSFQSQMLTQSSARTSASPKVNVSADSVVSKPVAKKVTEDREAIKSDNKAHQEERLVQNDDGTVRMIRSDESEKDQVEAKRDDTTTEDRYQAMLAERAVEGANQRARSMGTTAKFQYNEDINRITITIQDRETDKIVKEIPSEEMQKMIEKLHTMRGLLMDQEV